MWVNPKLASRLAESYASSPFDFGSNGNNMGGNTYFNNSYNNFRDNENWISNNTMSERINTYSSNPDGMSQQMRFNEITNQWLGSEQERNKPNNFINNLTNSFNGINGNVYPVQQKTVPQELTNVYSERVNDPSSVYQQQMMVNEMKQQQRAPQFTKVNKEGFDIDYTTERKFRNGTLTNELIANKQTTLIIIVLSIVGFILFMLFQLYMSQKRLEYMINIYRDVPINSPYYQAYNQN